LAHLQNRDTETEKMLMTSNLSTELNLKQGALSSAANMLYVIIFIKTSDL